MPATAQRSRRERQKAEIRAELLQAAHALVGEEGYEGLTIRKLAERVGYSAMSVYSYFPDKHAILLAIASDAFAELASRIQRDDPADPLEALKAMMRAYARFGLENPNEYRTVFMSDDPVFEPGKEPGEIRRQNPALQLLLQRVQACIDAGVMQGDTHAISTMLWTFGHGAVSLLITFSRYPFGERMAYVERCMDVMLAGIRAMDVAPLEGVLPNDC